MWRTPKRTPSRVRRARSAAPSASAPRARRASATLPSPSTSRKARPRPGPSSPAAACRRRNGRASVARWPSSQRASRWRTAAARRPAQAVGEQRLEPRRERGRPGQQARDGAAWPPRRAPGDDAPAASAKASSGAAIRRFAAAPQLGHQHAPRRRAERPLLGVLGARLEHVAQPLEPADDVAADHDRAVVLDRGERRAALQALEQRLGAPVDEALGQALVQRVAQRVLDRAGALLPMRRIVAASRRGGRRRSRCGCGRAARSACRCRRRCARAARPDRRPSRSAGGRGRRAGRTPCRAAADGPRSGSCGNPGSGRPPTAGARRRARSRALADRRAGAPAPSG